MKKDSRENKIASSKAASNAAEKPTVAEQANLDIDAKNDNKVLKNSTNKGGIKQKNAKKIKKKKRQDKEFTPHDLAGLKDDLDKKEDGVLTKLTTNRFIKKSSHGIILNKLVSISLVAILLVIGTLYAVSYSYAQGGQGINIVAHRDKSSHISLSDNSEFQNLTVGLRAKGLDSLDNITYDWLPSGLDEFDGGSHNGDNYIAYTFYVLNTGSENLNYTTSLVILEATEQIETAVRIMIYQNNTATIYTHTYEEIDNEITTTVGIEIKEFMSESMVSSKTSSLEKGDFDKMTIVIWLEGWDKDCTDDKQSAVFRLAWNFTV